MCTSELAKVSICFPFNHFCLWYKQQRQIYQRNWQETGICYQKLASAFRTSRKDTDLTYLYSRLATWGVWLINQLLALNTSRGGYKHCHFMCFLSACQTLPTVQLFSMDFALCTQTDIHKCQGKREVGLVFFFSVNNIWCNPGHYYKSTCFSHKCCYSMQQKRIQRSQILSCRL